MRCLAALLKSKLHGTSRLFHILCRAAPLAAPVTADLVYAIHLKQWGQGLMSEAVNAFCAFLFRRYPLEAITAEHFKDNPGSGRVLQKAGFVLLPV